MPYKSSASGLNFLAERAAVMRSTLLIICALLALVLVSLPTAFAAPADDRYAEHRLIEVTVDQTRYHSLVDQGLLPMACRPGAGSEQFVATESQLDALDRDSVAYRVIASDVSVLLAEQRRSRGRRDPTDFYASYRDDVEIGARLTGLAAAHPGLVDLLPLGLTHEGRVVHAVRISGAGSNKPAALLTGGQHAREWISVMVPMFIAEELATGYGNDSRITQLLDNLEVYVVPTVNPDGLAYTNDPAGDRLWRKNRRPSMAPCPPWLETPIGVDLNRNWPLDWNGGSASTTEPCNDLYVGPSPLSEPETSAVSNLIFSQPNIAAFIDYHNYSQLIIEPWSYTSAAPADAVELDFVGQAMSDGIHATHGNLYQHGPGTVILYPVSGGITDWTYDTLGALAYTIELPPLDNGNLSGGTGFLYPTGPGIREACEENLSGALVLMEHVAFRCGNGFLDPGEACDGPASGPKPPGALCCVNCSWQPIGFCGPPLLAYHKFVPTFVKVGPPFPEQKVWLSDRFTTSSVALGALDQIAPEVVPLARASTAPASNPGTIGFRLRRSRGSRSTLPKGLQATTQLESVKVDLKRADLLMIPSLLDSVAPPVGRTPDDRSHYRCYRVRTSRGEGRRREPLPLVVDDPLWGETVLHVRRPKHLCVAVAIDGDPAPGAKVDRLCYSAAPLRSDRSRRLSPLFVASDRAEWSLGIGRPAELCLPAYADLEQGAGG